MTIDNFRAEIKHRKVKPIYLLHGPESYYIDKISELFEHTFLSDREKEFNQMVVYAKDTDEISLVNHAKRFPVMSNFQLILVKEAQDLKWGKEAADNSKKTTDPLLSYLEKPVPSTILVFCYKNGKLDKRKKTYKAIAQNGVVFESTEVYPDKVALWIEKFVQEQNHQIHPQATNLLVEYLGNNLSKIANEVEKLMLSILPRRDITAQDVQQNIGISKKYTVFELQTAIAHRDIGKANQIAHYLANNSKANPLGLLLGSLSTYFSKVLSYHAAKDRSPSNLATLLGVHPFFVREYELAAKHYPRDKVFEIISYLRLYDLKTKGVDSTGNTPEGELLKELLFKILH